MASTEAGREFLAGGGDMGARIRAHAWADTPLGDPRGWPQALRTTVRVLLTTGHPTMIFWGPDLICIYNDAFSRSLGPEKHPGILGAPGRRAWAEVWPLVGGQVEQVLRGEGAIWLENQLVPIIRHGELQQVYWTYSYSPIDEPASPFGVGGVLVTCSETTQHVLSEQKLAAEREQFVQLFDQAPTFLAVLRGADHVIEIANPGYLKLIGNRPVVGRKIAEAVPEIAAQGYIAILDEVYRTGTTYTATAAKYIMQTSPDAPGEERYVDFVYQPFTSADGTVIGILVQGVDVTARAAADRALAQLNHQLREQDRRKDEFIATLSHELRNPLAPIRAAAKLIASPGIEAAQMQRAQLIIERQVTHMALLLDDLLDIARITQGKLHLKKETLVLFDVVDAAVEAVRPTFDFKRQQLTVRLPDQPVLLDADHLRLSQILSNLLTNASKYSDAGSQITLACSMEDDTLSLSVKDDGIGIAPESLVGIFEIFSQVQGGAGRSDGGLGIGLALVKGLSELHGGTAEARSAGLGHGSEFLVRLPLALPEPVTATVSRPEPPAMRRRVLIADDNRDAAESLSMLLELQGHEVRVAHRGHAAFALAQEFRPDTAVLDIGMPDLSGYELASMLRREPWAAHLQLIALTGWGQDHDRRNALEAGFDHHLIKPVDPQRLAKLIADPVSRK